ncbi:ribosome-associated translation inhibitor RaiA [Bacteriovoracaceae bacterium]|nr:ribosome-associated translation inhibitor RaiA [Bacteriovoracaceae bacterium]
MQIEITFRHLDHTPALDEKIRDKSKKFGKWFSESGRINWTCWKEGAQFVSEVRIHDHKKDFVAKSTEDDLYKTFDQVVGKIKNQVNP